MTALDLAAVCERHRIALAQTHEGLWRKRSGYGPTYDSEADAVCALLKARYRITTQQYRGMDEWRAYQTPDVDAYDQTELEAVAKLADRLRGAA